MPVQIDPDAKLPALPAISGPQIELYLAYLETSGRKRYSAIMAGVEPARLLYLMKKDDALAERQASAMDGYKELIHASVHDRAINGVTKNIYFQGKVCGTERQYSDTLLLALAKAHDPKFRDHVQIDASVTAGVLVVQASLDPDDWEKEYAGVRVDTKRIDSVCAEQNQAEQQNDGGGAV